MIKVGVAGYGVIGQRLADGVALQKDMELVGVADLAPTLSIRALKEKGMPYDIYLVDGADKSAFDALNIPVAGAFRDLVSKVDVMLDSSPGGVGAKNKELYENAGVKAIFQGGEMNSVADVFFHGYANYENGLNASYLKLTSCNTTGLIRSVDCLDRKFGIDRVAITIIRRVADPGDYHRGLTNALQIDKAPRVPGYEPVRFSGAISPPLLRCRPSPWHHHGFGAPPCTAGLLAPKNSSTSRTVGRMQFEEEEGGVVVPR